MRLSDRLGLPVLRCLDPETAHGLALRALRLGFGPSGGPPTSARLRTRIAGLDLPNPIGLAAGFDKNGTATVPLSRAGFGFIEIGAATPKPQPGNPRPRLFRLAEDQAAINRFGFNNDGAVEIAARLARTPEIGIAGINLGANKTSADRSADFAEVLSLIGPFVDFATVNVSSPNTERLRDLQGKAALDGLLAGVMTANAALAKPLPIFLKISPDLTPAETGDLVETALKRGIAAIIATNTTLAREGLASRHAAETGGLSGQPLFERSTELLRGIARLTQGAIPLIGVGGVGSAEQAYAKIRAGASAVQLYTAMVYRGIGLPAEIARGLDALLKRDGLTVGEAVGLDL